MGTRWPEAAAAGLKRKNSTGVPSLACAVICSGCHERQRVEERLVGEGDLPEPEAARGEDFVGQRGLAHDRHDGAVRQRIVRIDRTRSPDHRHRSAAVERNPEQVLLAAVLHHHEHALAVAGELRGRDRPLDGTGERPRGAAVRGDHGQVGGIVDQRDRLARRLAGVRDPLPVRAPGGVVVLARLRGQTPRAGSLGGDRRRRRRRCRCCTNRPRCRDCWRRRGAGHRDSSPGFHRPSRPR